MPQSGALGDIGKSALSGLSEGVSGILGMPHDIPALADYGIDWAAAHVNQMTGGENAQDVLKRTHGSAIRGAFGDNVADALDKFSLTSKLPGAADFQGAAERLPLIGSTLGYKPQYGPGRYAHEIASFLPGALIPGGEASLGARALQTVAPAIGSETLGNLAQGTSWEPWARMAGAGLGGLGHAVAGATTAQTADAAREWSAPFREKGQQDLAAQQFRAGTSEPDAALQKINAAQAQAAPGMATGENIPGSKPTTGQVTGDLGQLDMERQAQVLDPVAHAKIMTGQKAAQTTALQGAASGDSQNVADVVKNRLRDIDAQHEASVGAAKDIAEQTHAEHGQRLQTEAQNLEAQARTKTSQVARRGEPEVLGENARETLAASMARAKEKERKLWEAIDPHKKIGVVPTKIAARARNIAKDIGLQKPMEGEEKAVFDAAAGLPKWTRLADVTDLSSRLKAAMRQERFTNGNTPALRRMATLNTTMENIIANSATMASAAEAAAEREGLRAMTPADRKAMQQARTATKARGNIERGPAGEVIRQGATSGTYRTLASQVPGKVFTAGPSGYQRLKAYAEATGKPYMDPVHDIVSDSLAREATTDGVVDPAKLKRWQAKYSDALRALPDEVRRKFVGGDAAAAGALAEDAAARRESLIAHSKIQVGKEFDKQLAQGSPEAAEMRADPAFRGLEHADNQKDIQDRVGRIIDGPDPVRTMSRLREAMAGNPKAAEGLQRAALDHVLEKVTSDFEAGTTGVSSLKPGTTMSYINKNKDALRAAGFSDPQIGILENVVADIKRQQSFSATKHPGQSNTAQDVFRMLKESTEKGHTFTGPWGKLFAINEGWEGLNKISEFVHGWTGVPKNVTKLAALPAVLGANKLSHMRNAGLKNVAGLVHEAVMNPDKAAELLRRTTRTAPSGAGARLAKSWKRQALNAGLVGERTSALQH